MAFVEEVEIFVEDCNLIIALEFVSRWIVRVGALNSL